MIDAIHEIQESLKIADGNMNRQQELINKIETSIFNINQEIKSI